MVMLSCDLRCDKLDVHVQANYELARIADEVNSPKNRELPWSVESETMMTISMKLPNTYAEVDDYHGLWLSDAMKEEVFEVRSNVIFKCTHFVIQGHKKVSRDAQHRQRSD